MSLRSMVVEIRGRSEERRLKEVSKIIQEIRHKPRDGVLLPPGVVFYHLSPPAALPVEDVRFDEDPMFWIQ